MNKLIKPIEKNQILYYLIHFSIKYCYKWYCTLNNVLHISCFTHKNAEIFIRGQLVIMHYIKLTCEVQNKTLFHDKIQNNNAPPSLSFSQLYLYFNYSMQILWNDKSSLQPINVAILISFKFSFLLEKLIPNSLVFI